ncbi:TonB family protein [Catalinimonas alkaloidigena]|uniref:energy transducer TonB n=1 Tax=Catalinimonas alkaloidigena TaxID=1075417 RepID=UPI00240670CB|nr:TonB family protein [Catalinimonas alkaloidigena]MDF9796772.1 TonB family protein [Catalinimonas alkaloidigena]
MSKLHKDSDLLRTELMKKFRDGTLSAEEEAYLHALKSAEPFIADALEGTFVLEDGDRFADGVEELQGRILERAKTTKGHKVYWLPVAASLAVLLGLFYVVYTFLLPSDTSGLSRQEEVPSATVPEENAEKESELSPLSQLPPEDLTDSQEVNEEKLPQTLALVEPSAMSAYSGSDDEDSFSASPSYPSESYGGRQSLKEVEPKAYDENFTLSQGIQNSQEEGKTKADPENMSRSGRPSSAALQAMHEGWKTISGRVIDQENKNPLPGVNVLVKETTIGSITDVEGRFVIDFPQDYNKLVISSIGYQTTEVNVNQQDTLAVSLEQDMQSLSEVVTMGFGSEREEVSVTSAKPLKGMQAYRKYLSDHQRYPEDWKEGDKGVVKLSFTVFPNGKPGDIMVEKSAGDWLDQEAIRLLEEGPAWEPATRDGVAISQEVKLRVKFKK